MVKTSIYGLNKQDLITWFIKHNDKKFRATQAWDWLYIKRVTSFEAMTNLSKATIALLAADFSFDQLKTVEVQEAKDGVTAKYLFELEDQLMIRTILVRHEYGLSVSVSAQAGSNKATGLVENRRNLTVGEIVAQVMQVQHYLDEQGHDERVSHILVKGVGETFDNFDNVMKFLEIMNDAKGLEIGARHMTVSTNGLADKIREFADYDTQVNLAISLDAPNDDLRSKIMQIDQNWNFGKLFAAIRYYLEKTNRRITFEYTMLNGVNDHNEEAMQLAELLKDIRHLAYVSLIPYSPVTEKDQYSRSTKKRMTVFYETLTQHGINAKIRREVGTEAATKA